MCGCDGLQGEGASGRPDLTSLRLDASVDATDGHQHVEAPGGGTLPGNVQLPQRLLHSTAQHSTAQGSHQPMFWNGAQADRVHYR
jgi:hypothetical protein